MMYEFNEDEKNTIIDSLLNYEEILNPDELRHLPINIRKRLVLKRVHIRQVGMKLTFNKEPNMLNEDSEIIEEALIFIFF